MGGENQKGQATCRAAEIIAPTASGSDCLAQGIRQTTKALWHSGPYQTAEVLIFVNSQNIQKREEKEYETDNLVPRFNTFWQFDEFALDF
jgi:hypothetical protein